MSATDRKDMLYIGTCPGCNQLVAGAVDDRYSKHEKRETNKFVARMVRDGLRVEYISVYDKRNVMGHCTCEPNPRKAQQEAPNASA